MSKSIDVSKATELVEWIKSDRAWPVLAGFAIGVFVGVILRD